MGMGTQLRACALGLSCVAAIMGMPSTAGATTLDFESVGQAGDEAVIPNEYGGFDWSNFLVIDGEDEYPEYPGNGYVNGTVSGDFVAFNRRSQPIASITRDSTFNFIGAAFTAAWNEDLLVDVKGYLDGALLYSTTLTLSTQLYADLLFNWSGIDELTFFSYGGFDQLGYGGGRQFVIDDLQYTNVVATPIPAALPLFATAMLGLGVMARRRSRKQAQTPVI